MNCLVTGAKSRHKALETTISTSKIKKALKKSVLFTLVPQPEALIGFFGFLISPQGSKLTGHALAKQPPAITLEAVAFNLKIID